MQIRINLKIFLFLILFILTKQIKIYALLMIFGLIHELGHLFMGIILGLKPESISIMPTGFNIKFYDHSKSSENKKIIIALAGPIINILIAIICIIYYKIRQYSLITQDKIVLIIYANILIALFNLLPIFPLDGGRILNSFLRKYMEIEKVEKIVNKISNICIIILTFLGSVLILIDKNIGIFIIIIYLWLLVIKENKRIKLKNIIKGIG